MTSSEKAVSLNGKPVHLGQPEVNQSERSVNSKNTFNDECCSDVSVIDSTETDDSYTPDYETLNLIESDEFKKVELEKHLLNIIENQKLLLLLNFHKNELDNVITEIKSFFNEVSFEVMMKLSDKRLQQLEANKNNHFVAKGYLVEQKAWEILTVALQREKKKKFNKSKYIFSLIMPFYDNLRIYLEKNVELNTQLLTLTQMDKEILRHDYSQIVNNTYDSVKSIHKFKNQKFKECIDIMVIDLQDFFNKSPLEKLDSYETAEKYISLDTKTKLEDYLEFLEVKVENLFEDTFNLQIHLDNQQKNLQQVLKELNKAKTISKDYANLINKRIAQLKEVKIDNFLNSCFITKTLNGNICLLITPKQILLLIN